MSNRDLQSGTAPQPSPALVHSLTDELERRRAAAGPDAERLDELAGKLARDMRLVKRARFNAHERLEAKHVASVAAFTLAAIIEVSISLFSVIYEPTLQPDMKRFLDFASNVTAVFILGFGLVVGLKNFQPKAMQMQRCAMEVGHLLREMEIAMPLSRSELQEYRRRYHELEARYSDNHADVDRQRALVRDDTSRAARYARWAYRVDVYGMYVLTSVAYVAFWTFAWITLKQ